MTPLHQAFWSIAVGCVCGIACALVGCFLLLRRMSLMGDALSHGIVPGIALAVLLTGQLASLPLFLGAMVFGVLTAALAQALRSYAHVNEDAALGVVFTSLFALGVIFISQFPGHLDSCAFLGRFEFVPLDTFGDWDIPPAFPIMALALAATLAFVVLLWKELKLATFDPGLATAMGFSAGLIHYLLIALVAGVIVAAFEAFGTVLV